MFSDKIIKFNSKLEFEDKLPDNIRIMNPFKENPDTLKIIKKFYKKFYNDNRKRHLIIGINPGRFGAGVTGLPFTDTKRLKSHCGIEVKDIQTHELSSVFIYELIDYYGGVERFYSDFYIGAMCPLGFTIRTDKGKELNYNYYDSKELYSSVKIFMTENLRKQISFGIHRNVCFCLGNKNAKYLNEINEENNFFEHISVLEHPRYIMQYKMKQKEMFIEKYLKELRKGKCEKVWHY